MGSVWPDLDHPQIGPPAIRNIPEKTEDKHAPLAEGDRPTIGWTERPVGVGVRLGRVGEGAGV